MLFHSLILNSEPLIIIFSKFQIFLDLVDFFIFHISFIHLFPHFLTCLCSLKIYLCFKYPLKLLPFLFDQILVKFIKVQLIRNIGFRGHYQDLLFLHAGWQRRLPSRVGSALWNPSWNFRFKSWDLRRYTRSSDQDFPIAVIIIIFSRIAKNLFFQEWRAAVPDWRRKWRDRPRFWEDFIRVVLLDLYLRIQLRRLLMAWVRLWLGMITFHLLRLALIANLRLTLVAWLLLTLVARLLLMVAWLWLTKCAYRLLLALHTKILLWSNRFSSPKLIS